MGKPANITESSTSYAKYFVGSRLCLVTLVYVHGVVPIDAGSLTHAPLPSLHPRPRRVSVGFSTLFPPWMPQDLKMCTAATPTDQVCSTRPTADDKARFKSQPAQCTVIQ
eukprot:jgi/Ulvmu1/2557/UM014_0007.1